MDRTRRDLLAGLLGLAGGAAAGRTGYPAASAPRWFGSQAERTPLGPVYNPLDHGAKGDGASDDSEAINATVKAARAAGWGSVFLPPGHVFGVGRPIILPDGILLFSLGGLNHAPATIRTLDGYGYPNVVQNFAGAENENPPARDNSSFYVGLRDLQFEVRNSSVSTVVHLVHVWENSLFENLSFRVDDGSVTGAIFKHSANEVSQGVGGGFVLRNTNILYYRGSVAVRRLVDITAASAVQIVGGNWPVGFCDGKADAVNLNVHSGYCSVRDVYFEGSLGGERASLNLGGQALYALHGCQFSCSRERSIAIRVGGSFGHKGITLNGCAFSVSGSSRYPWMQIIRNEVEGARMLDLYPEGYAPLPGSGMAVNVLMYANGHCRLTREARTAAQQLEGTTFRGLQTKTVYTDSGPPVGGLFNAGDLVIARDRVWRCRRGGAAHAGGWSPSATYRAGQWVRASDGGVYRALRDVGSERDPVADSNGVYWRKLHDREAELVSVGMKDWIR